MRKIEYRTIIEGRTLYIGESKEDAIRMWDEQTYLEPVAGGITVNEWNAKGVCVRTDTILNVRSNGSVYLNPTI